jgi:CubicO group peptidase (beta-lactamase class C family)
MKYFNVPGGAIALIQNGKVIYAKGFGVRNIASGEPFTLDTVYRIGSTGKAITSMLVATEVDKGLVAWDTPVHSLRSDFQLPNQELTNTIQVQQLMNMGTGIDDAPFLEYADLDSPEHLWHTVRNLTVFAPPETEFKYNNSIYALGGYVGALARGVPIPKLLDYYKSAVKDQLFDPIGMPTTEVTDHPETLSNNVATPYKYDLTQNVYPLHPNTYTPIRAVTPAGGIASTMNDMTRYVITQLQTGVGPNGNRVVSALNLQKTWKGQIPLNPTTAYALGWVDAQDDDVRVVTHSGSLDGFKTDIEGAGVVRKLCRVAAKVRRRHCGNWRYGKTASRRPNRCRADFSWDNRSWKSKSYFEDRSRCASPGSQRVVDKPAQFHRKEDETGFLRLDIKVSSCVALSRSLRPGSADCDGS